jgi:uncharacterized protein
MKIFITLVLIYSSLIANNFNDGIKFYKEKNFKEAAVSFKKAANNGNLEASYILGYFYTGGLGVKHDLKESLVWYTKAASAGHVNAQINLGFMYIAGHGTDSNYKKAAYWINKAKQNGNEKALKLWNEFELANHIKEK